MDLLILCGGRSEEHEVSLLSAGCILKALDRKRFRPIVVGISRKGVWHLEKEDSYSEGEFHVKTIRLNEKAPQICVQPYLNSNGRGVLVTSSGKIEFDVVFPILHGQYGEDGCIQGLLETIAIPYVGAGVGGSYLCMDKEVTKTLCHHADIPIANFICVRSVEEARQRAAEYSRWRGPWFVKAARQGSSIGIEKVTVASEIPKAVQSTLCFDTKCLIEEGILGREIECSVLGTRDNARASLPGEIIPSPKIGWYSYEAKYVLSEGAQTLARAALTSDEVHTIQSLALRAFRMLECEGMARADFFLEPNGKVYLNELNTLPGFSPISMYPKMWEASGVSYPDLISELIDIALKRCSSKLDVHGSKSIKRA